MTVDARLDTADRIEALAGIVRRYNRMRWFHPSQWRTKAVQLENGQVLVADLESKDIGYWIVRSKVWEPEVTRFIRNSLPRGGVFIDAGANIGYFPVAVADLLGPDGQVFAFEPNPKLFRILRENFRINPIRGACHCHALGRSDYTSQLWVNEQSSGGGYLTKSPSGEEAGLGLSPQTVSVRSLDSFDMPPANVMKIDVEGFEPEVLAGARETIARSPGLRLVIEFSPSGWTGQGHDPAQVLDDLRMMGFSHMSLVIGSDIIDGLDPAALLSTAASAAVTPSLFASRL